jgi:hypothetical protein
MKLLLIALIAVVAVSQVASAACHNATGSCTKEHFVCANEELVPHAKRCDGVEDCADGTDEYLCDQKPTPLMELTPAERHAITEVSCIKCTCQRGSIVVQDSNTYWYLIALKAPRDMRMLTDAATVENKPCRATITTSITLNVYKKLNKGCRGFVCCFRQFECTTCTGTYQPSKHCWI